MQAKKVLPFGARDLLLVIAIVIVFVGAFVNCQVVRKSLAATRQISTALPGPDN